MVFFVIFALCLLFAYTYSMPADMLSPELQHPIETKTEQADPLLASKKDILKAFDKLNPTNEDLAKLTTLETTVTKATENPTVTKDVLAGLANSSQWCKDLHTTYDQFISTVQSFIDYQIGKSDDLVLPWSALSVDVLKTYCEQKLKIKEINKMTAEEKDEYIKVNTSKDMTNQIEEDSKFKIEEKKLIDTLASIEEKTLKNAEQIKKSPGFDEAKQKLEASTNQKIPDE